MAARPQFSTAEIEQQLGGRFTITRTVRSGAQGHVYRALRVRTPDGASAADDVALKLYFDPAQVARVEREVDAMDRLRLPCLANLIEHGTVILAGSVLHYVASEFIEGTPLDDWLRAQGPLPPGIVASVGRDVSTAIGHVWNQRIVHRDVNPKNVMLRKGEQEAVLIDLGIARHVAQEALTTVGTAWGTLGYMSPEQFQAERGLTSNSDVFSLGVVLQEALLGRHPTGCSQHALNLGPPLTEDLIPDAPKELANLIDRMLRLRPAFRPRVGELVDRFARLAQEQ
jgi:serine/threonine protein kinase